MQVQQLVQMESRIIARLEQKEYQTLIRTFVNSMRNAQVSWTATFFMGKANPNKFDILQICPVSSFLNFAYNRC